MKLQIFNPFSALFFTLLGSLGAAAEAREASSVEVDVAAHHDEPNLASIALNANHLVCHLLLNALIPFTYNFII